MYNHHPAAMKSRSPGCVECLEKEEAIYGRIQLIGYIQPDEKVPEKQIYRHPHFDSGSEVTTDEEVTEQGENLDFYNPGWGKTWFGFREPTSFYAASSFFTAPDASTLPKPRFVFKPVTTVQTTVPSAITQVAAIPPTPVEMEVPKATETITQATTPPTPEERKEPKVKKPVTQATTIPPPLTEKKPQPTLEWRQPKPNLLLQPPPTKQRKLCGSSALMLEFFSKRAVATPTPIITPTPKITPPVNPTTPPTKIVTPTSTSIATHPLSSRSGIRPKLKLLARSVGVATPAISVAPWAQMR